jgi:hypothetical protein
MAARRLQTGTGRATIIHKLDVTESLAGWHMGGDVRTVGKPDDTLVLVTVRQTGDDDRDEVTLRKVWDAAAKAHVLAAERWGSERLVVVVRGRPRNRAALYRRVRPLAGFAASQLTHGFDATVASLERSHRQAESYELWAQSRPKAGRADEEHGRALMMQVSCPAEWAARYAHTVYVFSMDMWEYEDPALTDWMRELGACLRNPQAVHSARKKFLSRRERRAIRKEQIQECRALGAKLPVAYRSLPVRIVAGVHRRLPI